jgi:hypothetical protein
VHLKVLDASLPWEQLHGYISDAMPVRAMVELNPDEPELIKKLSGSPAELGKQYEDIFENIPYNYLLSRAPSVSHTNGHTGGDCSAEFG